MNNIEKAYLLIGLAILVVSAVLMIFGRVIGDSSTGFAQVLLITGISFVGASRKTSASL